jgi:hypothetical protein
VARFTWRGRDDKRNRLLDRARVRVHRFRFRLGFRLFALAVAAVLLGGLALGLPRGLLLLEVLVHLLDEVLDVLPLENVGIREELVEIGRLGAVGDQLGRELVEWGEIRWGIRIIDNRGDDAGGDEAEFARRLAGLDFAGMGFV